MYDPEILLRSPAFLEKLCAHVVKGASPHMAARFEGMKERDYWRFWSEGKKAEEKPEQERTELDEFLIRFVDRIELALAEARIDAEKRVFEKNPSAYLRYGSGREGGAEAKGWESGIDREKSLFASSPLKYLLEGAGQPGQEMRIGWSRGRFGKMVPYVIEEEPSLSETEAFFEKLFGTESKNPPPANSSPHPRPPADPSPHRQRGDENSELPLSIDTERGLGGEVCSPKGKTGPGP